MRVFPTLLAVTILTLCSASLAAPARYRLGATIDPDEQRVFGTVEIAFDNPTREPLSAAYVWLYPNRLRSRPPTLDESNWYFVYPVEFDEGRIRVTDVSRDGAPVAAGQMSEPRTSTVAAGTLLRIRLEPSLPPGARTVLSLRFKTRVPERFGMFGSDGARLTLAAPFYPMLAALGPRGFDLEAPADDSVYDVLLTAPSERDVVINGERSPAAQEEPGWRRIRYRGSTSGLAVLVQPPFDVARTRHLGVTLEYLSAGPRYRSPPSRPDRPMATGAVPGRLPDWVLIDEPAAALQAMREAVEVLNAVGLPPAVGSSLRVVEAPLRLRLATESPGAVIVSDRIYRILPFERTRRFHSLEMLRAIFAQVILQRFGAQQPPRDRFWISDAIATALVEFYVLRATGAADSARRLLGFAAFHPAVDQFLYAPQIAFAEAYFAGVEEPDPLRDEPWRFANLLPRGRRVLAKLRDLLTPAQYSKMLRLILLDHRPFREAAAEAAGRDLDQFFATWLGAYPRLNYRLAGTRSRRRPDGLWNDEVVIERQGEAVTQPVAIQVVDEEGGRHDLRWEGEGSRGRVAFTARGAIDEVVVDPQGRLLEDPALTPNHPRYDNLSPAPWRPPILNSAALDLSVAEGQPDLSVDFTARRQYDLRNSLGLGLRSTARGVGGNVRYFRGFGGKRNLNYLEWFAGGVLNVDRLSSDFADFGQPGTSIGLTGALYRDSRHFVWDPWSGSSISIAAGPSFTVLDDGSTSLSGSGGVRASTLWTPAPGRTFAFFVGGGLAFGELLPHEEQSLAGPSLLRAYEVDEARGRARLYGITEYRHTLIKALGWNVVHFVWFRGLQLVGFAAGGTVTPNEDYSGLFAKENTYLEAGGGVRFHFDFFGVQPGVMALDLAIPLSRTLFDWVDDCASRTEEGYCQAHRRPWALRLSFDQTL